MNNLLRLRTIVAMGLLLGCTPLPAAPTFRPADGSPPAGPTPARTRLTGSFVWSGSATARLSGGFVWHGGSTRLTGWLQ